VEWIIQEFILWRLLERELNEAVAAQGYWDRRKMQEVEDKGIE